MGSYTAETLDELPVELRERAAMLDAAMPAGERRSEMDGVGTVYHSVSGYKWYNLTFEE